MSNPIAADPFLSPRLKIERAERHIQELHAVAKTFRDSNPYSGFVETDQKAGQLVYKLRILKPIPNELAAITGDAIQNLRAALDHAVCCLAIQKNPSVNINDISFPIAGDPQEFKTRAEKTIKKLAPEARAFIEAMKPYKGGADEFWRLHRLGVRDRHRVLLPTWVARGSVGITFMLPAPETGEKVKSPRIFINPASKFAPLEDGSELFRMPISAAGDIIDDEIHAQFDIGFGDGEVVIAEPIGPALVQLHDFVKNRVIAIEKRFFS